MQGKNPLPTRMKRALEKNRDKVLVLDDFTRKGYIPNQHH
ncbi:uncharacterized protein Dvar_40130 [Desulfosarcina variabilis str. Montpellier]